MGRGGASVVGGGALLSVASRNLWLWLWGVGMGAGGRRCRLKRLSPPKIEGGG